MAPTKNPKNSILCGSPYTFISTRHARLNDPHHLSDALRHFGKQHDAELGSGHVEGVIVELIECVAIHDTCLDFEPLLARSRTEQFEH